MTTMLQCPLTHCYTAPSVKHTVNNREAFSHISEWQTFSILDKLRPTSTGPDGIPAWFATLCCSFIQHTEPVVGDVSGFQEMETSMHSTYSKNCHSSYPRRLQTYLNYLCYFQNSRTYCRQGVYIYPSLCNPPPSLTFRPVRLPTNRINHSGNCPSCPHYHCRS